MPTVEAQGKTFEFPEGTTTEQIGQALDEYFSDAGAPEVGGYDEDQGILESAANVGLEAMAGVNRGVMEALDFLGPDQINAALQLAGSDKRVPTLMGSDLGQAAGAGNFMDEGFARDVAGSAGELASMAVAPQQIAQKAASNLPRIAEGGESVLSGVVRQAAQETPEEAIKIGAAAGAGAELGGEGAAAIGGEDYRQIGEMLGGMALPTSIAVGAKMVENASAPSYKSLMAEASPEIDALKAEARKIYGELDDAGAVVDSSRIAGLSSELRKMARKEGFNKRIHPKVSATLKEFDLASKSDQSLGDLDVLRRVAMASARSNEPDEARLGANLLQRIDDFQDNLSPGDFVGKSTKAVGEKYRDARQLWRRAKKSEDIREAFFKADNQATGIENGLRTQFRSILNNKKKRKNYNDQEIEAMKRVVQGDLPENIAKKIGRLAFGEGQASNLLGGSIGVTAGGLLGGTAGAVAVPIIGQVSRNLAQKMTRNNAQMADDIVRAGPSGPDVVKAYMKSTKPSERSSEELAELLIRPDVSLGRLTGRKSSPNKIVKDAVSWATIIKMLEDSEDAR